MRVDSVPRLVGRHLTMARLCFDENDSHTQEGAVVLPCSCPLRLSMQQQIVHIGHDTRSRVLGRIPSPWHKSLVKTSFDRVGSDVNVRQPFSYDTSKRSRWLRRTSHDIVLCVQ